MLICPDCGASLKSLNDGSCRSCEWAIGDRGGIPELLSRSDRSSSFFADYLATYDRISVDDLTETMQGDEYLRVQVERLFGVTGIDIALPYLRRYAGAEDVRVVVANAENIPFRNEFDLLIASEVLEHVLNVGDLLLSARRALRSGGRLVVKVPYREDLSQYARARGCPYRFVHLRTFTREA